MQNEAVDLYKVTEIELRYKSKVKASERPKICHSKDAYAILLQYWDDNKLDFVEQFKVLLLNQANRVLGICDIATGGITATVADVRVILTAALKANACGIILAHNHPSGNLESSKQDKDMTAKIKEAGSYMDIKILDHLIVTREGYYSFADEGTCYLEMRNLPF